MKLPTAACANSTLQLCGLCSGRAGPPYALIKSLDDEGPIPNKLQSLAQHFEAWPLVLTVIRAVMSGSQNACI
jgi:hypothetical protein